MLRRSLIVALSLSAALVGAPAHAEPQSHIATFGSTYYPGDTTGLASVPLVVRAGTELILTNVDPVDDHAVTSIAFKPGSWDERLFETQPLGFREQEIVIGVADLAPGRYPFFCFVHTNMRGAIDVLE